MGNSQQTEELEKNKRNKKKLSKKERLIKRCSSNPKKEIIPKKIQDEIIKEIDSIYLNTNRICSNQHSKLQEDLDTIRNYIYNNKHGIPPKKII